MSDIALTVEDLSKRYLVGHQAARRTSSTTLRDVVAREARDLSRKTADLILGRQIVQGDEIEEFWALKDLCFEIKQGEIVGIIGRNGAGKSTLLKILSRITEPTLGRVTLRGRVASLLEVGSGFHLELTGRENIFVNGAILGMKQHEIRKRFDEIVAFAEVEHFLDTPVKHYSSGMYVRLAFAVAAHLEPDILIIDEALAVGDAEFQKKCLGKIDDASKREGRTVLFVSHNTGVISALCPTVIWLDKGSIYRKGPVRDVMEEYLTRGFPNPERFLSLKSMARPDVRDERLGLESVEWLCDFPLRHGEPVRARINLRIEAPLTNVAVGIGFSTVDGTRLLTYESDFPEGNRQSFIKPGQYSADVEIDSLSLAPDVYSLDIGCRSGDFHSLDFLPAVAQIEVMAGPTTPAYLVKKGAGVRLSSKWTWFQ